MTLNQTKEDNGLTIDALVRESYLNAKVHGFWEDIGTAQSYYILAAKLCLIHSEISEALEELRDGPLVGDRVLRYTDKGKPEGFATELADAVIRIADLAGFLSIDLGAVILAKMEYNEGRPFMHGKTL